MRAPSHGIRKRGTGAIHRAGSKWQATAPERNGHGVYIGRFDTYREAERAISDFLKRQAS